MNFGQALEALKAGSRVSRSGWNGKGMWIVLVPGDTVPAHSCKSQGALSASCLLANLIGPGDTVCVTQPYIAMWTASHQWQAGWLCSQADMLAEDWEVVPGVSDLNYVRGATCG
jgi:hypothetical protein